MTRMLTIAAVAALTLGAPDARAEDPAGDVAAGETRYAVNCVNCHGRAGKGLASFPAIAGRDAAYIAQRLTQYRGGEQVGWNTALMRAQAIELTDEEIADLAAYIAATFN
ncbi:MAG: c-type cytochrome [Pseudomonadota bacterium]